MYLIQHPDELHAMLRTCEEMSRCAQDLVTAPTDAAADVNEAVTAIDEVVRSPHLCSPVLLYWSDIHVS